MFSPIPTSSESASKLRALPAYQAPLDRRRHESFRRSRSGFLNWGSSSEWAAATRPAMNRAPRFYREAPDTRAVLGELLRSLTEVGIQNQFVGTIRIRREPTDASTRSRTIDRSARRPLRSRATAVAPGFSDRLAAGSLRRAPRLHQVPGADQLRFCRRTILDRRSKLLSRASRGVAAPVDRACG